MNVASFKNKSKVDDGCDDVDVVAVVADVVVMNWTLAPFPLIRLVFRV